jgi:manganese transport system ATP-binding protein
MFVVTTTLGASPALVLSSAWPQAEAKTARAATKAGNARIGNLTRAWETRSGIVIILGMLRADAESSQPKTGISSVLVRSTLGPVPSAITTRGLEARYGDTIALSDLDLDVPAGSSLAVIGPNGSGKSTLLGALAGTIEPSAGQVSVTGPAPALVLQSTDVDRSLPITVRDTVSLARYSSLGLFRRFQATDRDAIDKALARLDITDLAGRKLHDLSGGQRQRALVAQGLAQDTEVLLLDEPVTGLDMVSRLVILDVIDEEVAAGRTVVMTTHSLDEARRCDQILLLDTAPIAVGSPTEVVTDEHLRRAFGGRFMRIGDSFLLDDPHHDHTH